MTRAAPTSLLAGLATAFALTFALALAASPTRAATFDVRVPAKTSDNFSTAEFRLWIDDAAPATQPLRALLVLAPGWNGDGRRLAEDKDWQALARELGAGIVAAHWRSDNLETRPPYHLAHLGSGAGWQQALARLAEASQRPELEKIPWLLWGHSAGGQLGYGLACVYPERVAGFVAVKGGIYETEFDPRARGVPGLFIIGETDASWRAANITALFERERRHGAAWAAAWEVGAGHGIGRSSLLARAYLREVAALRLRPEGDKGVNRLHIGQGVVAKRADFQEIKDWPSNADARVRTVWLPGPESLRLWQALGARAGDETDKP